MGKEGASGNKHEAEYDDYFLKISFKDRAAQQGTELYLIDTFKLKEGWVSVDLH